MTVMKKTTTTTEFRLSLFILLSIWPLLILGDGLATAISQNGSDYTEDRVANGSTPINAFNDFLFLRRGDGQRQKKREVKDGVKKIICYHCRHDPEGIRNMDCLDPFWEHDVSVVSCKGTCVKTKKKVGEGLYNVRRACWTLKCTESSTVNLTRTCCNTDHCNSADSRHWSRYGLALTIPLVVLGRHLALS